MYPLNVVLIGCHDHLLPCVRRELMNCSASLEAECLDVRSAVATLRKKPSEKRLLILYVDSSHELDELSRLSACLPGWPLLALVGGDHPHSGSSGGIIGVMRRWAAQIVYLPIQPVDFKAALDRLAVQFVFTAQDTKVIAVAGSTGGSGCTTIAINLAYEIACRHGLRCVLAELSLRMGAVAAHLNIEPTHTIIDLLKDARRVDTVLAQKVLHQVAENLHVLAGPHQFVTPSNVSIEDLTHIVDTVKQMTEVVVLDLPCTLRRHLLRDPRECGRGHPCRRTDTSLHPRSADACATRSAGTAGPNTSSSIASIPRMPVSPLTGCSLPWESTVWSLLCATMLAWAPPCGPAARFETHLSEPRH